VKKRGKRDKKKRSTVSSKYNNQEPWEIKWGSIEGQNKRINMVHREGIKSHREAIYPGKDRMEKLKRDCQAKKVQCPTTEGTSRRREQ